MEVIPAVWFVKKQWNPHSIGMRIPPKWWNGLSILEPMECPFHSINTFYLPKITLRPNNWYITFLWETITSFSIESRLIRDLFPSRLHFLDSRYFFFISFFSQESDKKMGFWIRVCMAFCWGFIFLLLYLAFGDFCCWYQLACWLYSLFYDFSCDLSSSSL